MSIGYDMETMCETFLIFEDAYRREDDLNEHLRTVLEFIASRDREWTYVYFQGRCANYDCFDFIQDECLGTNLNSWQRRHLLPACMLYPEPGCCAKIKRFFKRVEKYVVLHPDLHSFIKEEKRGNTAYIQAVLRNLQREAM